MIYKKEFDMIKSKKSFFAVAFGAMLMAVAGLLLERALPSDSGGNDDEYHSPEFSYL
ncbi:MAG: hypothetical protein IJU95_07015 [Treponema sp.]|nr:hypothetical protein [Treponema sp.]